MRWLCPCLLALAQLFQEGLDAWRIRDSRPKHRLDLSHVRVLDENGLEIFDAAAGVEEPLPKEKRSVKKEVGKTFSQRLKTREIVSVSKPLTAKTCLVDSKS